MIKKPANGTAFSQEPWVNGLATAGKENFFNGGFQTGGTALDPFISGYAFIYWTKVPVWIDTLYPGFREFSQKNLRAFSGVSTFEMSGVSVNAGFTGNENMVAGSITKSQGFSLTHREYSGSPVRNAYTAWQTGIRDPETNLARYPKEYSMEYSAKNHTGELMYIVTRPDADNVGNSKIIEYAQYIDNIMPLSVPKDHLNFAAGTNDGAEFEVSFTGNHHCSKKVDEYAMKILSKLYKFKAESDFNSSLFK